MALPFNLCCRLCRRIRPVISSAIYAAHASNANPKWMIHRKRRVKREGTKDLPCPAIPLAFDEKLRKWRELIKLEIKAQTDKIRQYLDYYSWDDLVDRGLALGGLSLISEAHHPTLGYIVDLKAKKSSASRFFRAGTPLVLCNGNTVEHVGECVFLSSSEDNIRVQVRGILQLPSALNHYALIPSSSVAALQPIEDFLYGIKRLRLFPGFNLLLMAYRARSFPVVHNDRSLPYDSKTLNENQKKAVDAALNKSRPLVVVHGPPGTGKTAVVTEIILQAVKQKQKVLVCAPTHLAVDNVLNRVRDKVNVCRLGTGSEDSLDCYTENDEKYDSLVKLTTEMNDIWENRGNKGIFHKLKRQATYLRNEIQQDIVKSKDVVFCTLLSGILRRLWSFDYRPDLIIIDEAAQAFECVSWLPIMCASRCVLAGDHNQLSALLSSSEAAKGGLGTSLMESLCHKFGPVVSHLLSIQYRMNEKIMRWSSDQFYKGKLEADPSVANRTLSEISNVPQDSLFNEPLLMLDTYSPDNPSQREEFHKMSYMNRREAEVVMTYIKYLRQSGVRDRDIGVITPYYAQVQYLKNKLGPEIVRTVDGFQGQQKEVIVMSLVRDNLTGDIGFLQDERRLNVAVTRAQRQFLLVANSKMMEGTPHLASLLNYIRKSGKIVRFKVPQQKDTKRVLQMNAQ